MTNVILNSVLTCPDCGHAKNETMPTDACQWFYECKECHTVLRPKPGDCCVFCSYGSVPCPPIQSGSSHLLPARNLKVRTHCRGGPRPFLVAQVVRRSEWDDRAAYRIASNTSRSAGFGLEAETAHLKRYLGITQT